MKGFNNLGNTCYLNSGLQMLIQNRDLCNIIMSLSSKSTVFNKLSEFIKNYYDGNDGAISPNYVKELAGDRNSMFIGFQQQDTSEFLIFFLDYLNSEINKIIPGKNIIDKVFEIEETTNTKCKVLSCLNISQNIEKSTIMMLNINSECENLDDCLQFSKQRIKLEGENKYYCEKCKKKRIASQRREISKWPNHLIVILKRYEQKGTRFFKHAQEIKIPIEWRNNYKLKGVVLHSGNLYGGHYVYAGLVNNKWY